MARPAPSLQRQRQQRQCDHENYNRLTPRKSNSTASSFRFHHDGAGNYEGGEESRGFANGAAAGSRASHRRSRRYDDVDFERRGRCDRRCRACPDGNHDPRARERAERWFPASGWEDPLVREHFLEKRGQFIDNGDNDYCITQNK